MVGFSIKYSAIFLWSLKHENFPSGKSCRTAKLSLRNQHKWMSQLCKNPGINPFIVSKIHETAIQHSLCACENFAGKHFCVTEKFMKIYDYRSGIWPPKEIFWSFCRFSAERRRKLRDQLWPVFNLQLCCLRSGVSDASAPLANWNFSISEIFLWIFNHTPGSVN